MSGLLKELLVSVVGVGVTVGVLAGANTFYGAARKAPDDNRVVVAGSTSMQLLAQEAAARFASRRPEARVTVEGGGSAAGLARVAQGKVEVGSSSMPAGQAQIAAGNLVEHKVAAVGIAVVVNPAVTVANLTSQQLIDIFTRKVTNWSQVGGPDLHIMLITRSTDSGVRAAFLEHALGGRQEDRIHSLIQDSSESMRKMVASMKGAIGYLPLPYVDDSVRAVALDGVEASQANIAGGSYKLWTYEYLYTKGEPEGAAKAYIEYMLDDEVQDALLPSLGYLPADMSGE